MGWRFSMPLALLVLGGMVLVPAQSGAGVACGEVLEKACIGCHESDRFCGRLGAPEKELRALLKRMVANGAELEKDEFDALAACLSEPAEGARMVCGK